MLMTPSELICHGIYCSLPRGTVRGPADLFLFHPELVLNSKKKKASCGHVSGAQRFEAHTDLCL